VSAGASMYPNWAPPKGARGTQGASGSSNGPRDVRVSGRAADGRTADPDRSRIEAALAAALPPGPGDYARRRADVAMDALDEAPSDGQS
jgi:hypothetical protein